MKRYGPRVRVRVMGYGPRVRVRVRPCGKTWGAAMEDAWGTMDDGGRVADQGS